VFPLGDIFFDVSDVKNIFSDISLKTLEKAICRFNETGPFCLSMWHKSVLGEGGPPDFSELIPKGFAPMLANCLQSERLPLTARIRILEPGEDGHDFDLYRTYPYFEDVLEWLTGTRPFANIRHAFELREFEKDVLPGCLSRMHKARLLRREGNRYVARYARATAKPFRHDYVTFSERISSDTDQFLQRVFASRITPGFDLSRSRASSEKIAEWTERLEEILDEVQGHFDPAGEPFSAHIMTLQGA